MICCQSKFRPSALTSLVNQGIELANTAARNSGLASVTEAATKEILRNASGRLGLTPEQQQQVSTVIQSAVDKRMAAVTDLTSAMSTEPGQIMEMLLGGDALARKEIPRDYYDRITLPTRTMLQPGQIPIMELGKVDQAIASMQQMADAARQMMEALRRLKEANLNNPGNN